jgi:hypothetical protein
MKVYSNAVSMLTLLVFACVFSGSAMAQRSGHGGGSPSGGGARPPGGAPPAGGAHPPAGGAHPPGGGYGHGYAPGYGHGYGWGWGLSLGFPLYWPGYYYPGYYSYPYGYPGYYYPGPGYTYPAYSGEYIEQGASQPPPPSQPQGDWYFCAGSNAYYPYVRECPGGWQRVPSVPPR